MKKILFSVLSIFIFLSPFCAEAKQAGEYLFKDLQNGMSKKDVIALYPAGIENSQGNITVYGEKFADNIWNLFIVFHNGRIDSVHLISIPPRDIKKVQFLVLNIIEFMTDNNFISTYFSNKTHVSQSLNENVIMKGIRDNYLIFLCLETDAIKKSFPKTKPKDIRESVVNYPKDKRIALVILSEDLCSIEFALRGNSNSEVIQLYISDVTSQERKKTF